MINSKEFTHRLETLLEYYNESASSFAEKIGVQRSSISHLLSGRNKPSLDFILKILSAYPEVELYWLLNGKGNFPADMNNEKPVSEIHSLQTKKSNIADTKTKQEIDRIIIFFKDGTFKNFNPSIT